MDNIEDMEDITAKSVILPTLDNIFTPVQTVTMVLLVVYGFMVFVNNWLNSVDEKSKMGAQRRHSGQQTDFKLKI
jgi:hypothetical protein